MTGTVVTAEETFSTIRKVSFAWTSTAGGAASDITTKAYSGQVLQAQFIPGAGGNAPSANYDVTVTDEEGTDVLMGAGANCSDTVTNSRWEDRQLGVVANDTLTLNVSNAGNAKTGTVILFIR